MKRSHRQSRRGATRGVAMITGAALMLAGCADAAPRPEEPTDLDVAIAVDGFDLVGTLRLPGGQGPHPGVVIAHGSGPQGRRGLAPGQLGLSFPAPVPVYEQLAEGLRAAGFAVLTFDKRSCGPFNACADNDYPLPSDDLLFDTFVGDVDQALDFLMRRDEVDGIAVIGHSKGGTIAATLAAERDDLGAVVLLATPSAPINEVLTTQAATFAELVQAAGQSDHPGAAEQVAEIAAFAQTVEAIADGDVDGPPVGGASRAFWSSWIEASRAAPHMLAQYPGPVLVLGGSSDWNVPAHQVQAWESILGASGQVRILAGITHALTRLDVDDLSAITPADLGTVVDEQVIVTIADWLHAQMA